MSNGVIARERRPPPRMTPMERHREVEFLAGIVAAYSRIPIEKARLKVARLIP